MLFVFRSGENETKVANVRRENKLYSYQEQLADLELRKVCVHGIKIASKFFFMVFFIL
jgi:hypothetical protein